MKQPKARSAISFMRRGLKMKGRTEHNGRGAFVCTIEDKTITWEQLKERALQKAEQWKAKGVVTEIVHHTPHMYEGRMYEAFLVVFNEAQFGIHYVTVDFSQAVFEDYSTGRYMVLC